MRRASRPVRQGGVPPVETVTVAVTVAASDFLLRRAIEECRAELPARPAQALAARLGSGGVEPDEALASLPSEEEGED